MTKTVSFSTKVIRLVGKTIPLRTAFWILGLSLGSLQAWSQRFNINNPDGVSYLDIGDAYMRGDWQSAINAYWSPLYSWLLGIAIFVLHPSPYWEFFVVKLVNLGIFVVAFISFEFFLRQMIKWQQNSHQKNAGQAVEIPEWMWLVMGYFLFLLTALKWTPVHLVSPDALTVACVYAASGFMLQMRNRTANWGTYLLFGMVLGLGYLSKAVMFPLAFVFFFVAVVVSLFEEDGARQAWRIWQNRLKIDRSLVLKLTASILVFILVVAPFITALSLSKGRLTFGDSGRLNYVWFINWHERTFYNPSSIEHWQGKEPNSGIPKHPVRQILDDPAAYEFATPVGGTYAPWTDASYWQEGIKPNFNLLQQLKVAGINLVYYWRLFLGGLLLSYWLLVYAGGYVRTSLQQLAARWFLWLPGLAALVIYTLVIDLRAAPGSRYVAPFVVLIYAGVFSSVCLRYSQTAKRLLISFLGIALIVMNIQIFANAALQVQRIITGSETPIYSQVVEELHQLGLRSGDSIAVIGRAHANSSGYWARLGRIRIIADALNATRFWSVDAASRSKVLQAFEKTGAKAVFSGEAGIPINEIGWQKLESGVGYIYFFNRA
ncbi:hypothetical protein NC981_14555 [Leptolyngbya sp. DQ-M1]|uniref:hypothetical protein n=1 Tax=Leptolyngbya sp. DQ-M1 TaxID=2933920 RepID=UPI003296C7E4